MTQDDAEGRKERSDRRRRALPIWHPRRLRGRRMRQRRDEEHARPYLVDRVSWPVFALVALLLVLTLVDGMITVELLDLGCEEANPVMRFLLERSTGAFFSGKYLLTAVFLPVSLVMYQYPLFGTRFRVGHLIPIVALLYLILIAYQIRLWNSINDGAQARDSRSRGPVLPGGFL